MDDDDCCNMQTQGPQGSIGFQGSNATRGAQGSVGYQSAIVTVGPRGPQGLEGDVHIGWQGMFGYQAETNIGSQGQFGAQGTSGNSIEGLPGPLGVQGLDGNVTFGFRGSQGLTSIGPQGFDGPIGYQGTSIVGPSGIVQSMFGDTLGPILMSIDLTTTSSNNFTNGLSAGNYMILFDGVFSSGTANAFIEFQLSNSPLQVFNTQSANTQIPFNLQTHVSSNVPFAVILSGRAQSIPVTVNIEFTLQRIRL